METFFFNGVVQAGYKANDLGQQAIRNLAQTGQMINSIYGPDGNWIAEFDFDPVANTSTLIREYIWFEGKPIAVIEGGVVYYVRSDHIGKPVFATDATGGEGLGGDVPAVRRCAHQHRRKHKPPLPQPMVSNRSVRVGRASFYR